MLTVKARRVVSQKEKNLDFIKIIFNIFSLFQLYPTVGYVLAQLLMITTAQWMTVTVTTAAKRATGRHVTTTPLR